MERIAIFVTLLCLTTQVLAANPFSGASLYVNPDYTAKVQATINANPAQASIILPFKNVSTAYWVDTMAKISTISIVLDGAKAQQAQQGGKVVTVFVIYDLPQRDCAALASNGEISCADTACSAGITQYKTQYIDKIVQIFKQYPTMSIVALVEPDSLPNLATNLNVDKCSKAQDTYKTCVAYAIQQLGSLSNVQMYVDAAHGGWLGWPNNLAAMSTIFKSVLDMAGGQNLIRGFVTNVANYQPLASTDDPCKLAAQGNNAINEVQYVTLLNAALEKAGITNKGFVIDTSRNGNPGTRSSCSNWCNIKNSGMGIKPTTSTASSLIDAYYWVKVPGESDGTSDSSAARFDSHCTSVDSVTPAPEAGQWFASFFVTLCNGGNPIPSAATISTGASTTGSTTAAGSTTAGSATTSSGTTASAASTGFTTSQTSSTTGYCSIGSERCACTVGGSCDKGLTCLSNVCVDYQGIKGSDAASLRVGLLFFITVLLAL